MTLTDDWKADPFAADLALGARGLLREFNRSGVLAPADVHVATRLSRLAGETDERVVLAAALGVRGPRYGHVRTDMRTVRSTVVADVEDRSSVDDLSWPDQDEWLAALAVSPLVALGEEGNADRPLRLVDESLYLDRYWRDECFIAADLLRRCTSSRPVDEELLKAGLKRLFAHGSRSADEQRLASAVAVLRQLTVIAGGPGTGKTTTIARVIALLHDQADVAGVSPPLIALAAPTGKAAARMEEAVRQSASQLDASDEVRDRLRVTEGLTIHRLLRKRPDSSSRFRHDRSNRLPHDVVIVDETSMVSLSLMARLLEAIRTDAKVILVGDPEQLASVEAGAVLGDIVGPAVDGMVMSGAMTETLGRLTGTRPQPSNNQGSAIADSTVMLSSNFRFSGPLAELASAVRRGDHDSAIEQLTRGQSELRWVDEDVNRIASGQSPKDSLAQLRDRAVAAGSALFRASTDGDAPAALAAIADFRLLCAHRGGPGGVEVWTELVESWLAEAVEGFDPEPEWYPGRPVMITANDYSLRLFNGDTGAAIVRPDGGLGVVFPRGGSMITVSPARLSTSETLFATTVHKSQGSEFEHAALVLPPPESPLLSRELLYTAVTRAKRSLVIVGTEDALRAAISRPIARASGLTRRLWTEPLPTAT
ncbi:MAG TPA: exodeoxyribonuclease V subunit alpha [Acidimicrobiales bacterium]|nr:exodeoxyribonuclease V subunit alpha [Acidimicrobiales bacterium]